MGIVFGMTSVQEPAFSLVYKGGAYCIRDYSPYVIASVPMSGYGGAGQPFGILAKYIGVFGIPQNKESQAMAMTAPVLTHPTRGGVKMAMTAPVLTEIDSMSFVLPFDITDASRAPKPLDDRIKLKTIPKKKLAVLQFSGFVNENIAYKKTKALISYLKKDKYLEENVKDGDLDVEIAQYNPPFTIPWLRRNEVWIDLTTHLK